MIHKELTIINKLGLHARAAAKFVSLASRFECDVHVMKDTRKVNGKSIMGVMMLAASQHTTISVFTDGADEQTALEKLEELINQRFDEKE